MSSGEHPDYSIFEISQNTEKSPGDLKLVVTQTPVKNHQLTLQWKILKELNNNNNNNNNDNWCTQEICSPSVFDCLGVTEKQTLHDPKYRYSMDFRKFDYKKKTKEERAF